MLAKMVEQRRQLLLEQRQPMLHSRQAPTVADRLIERIAGGVGAELLAVAGAESLDRFLVEQRLARWHQGESTGLAGRPLVGRIEAAHRFDFVAEEVEADRQFLARRKQVDDRAAYREFAGIMDRVGPLVAIGDEQLDQPVALDPLALRQAPGQLADTERGNDSLGRCIGSGDQQLRALCACPAAFRASPVARP